MVRVAVVAFNLPSYLLLDEDGALHIQNKQTLGCSGQDDDLRSPKPCRRLRAHQGTIGPARLHQPVRFQGVD